MSDLRYPRVTVYVEVSIDDGPSVTFGRVGDRGALDVFPGGGPEGYAGWAHSWMADSLKDAMVEAARLAGLGPEVKE